MGGERGRRIIPSATIAERDIDDDNFRVTRRQDRGTPYLDAAYHVTLPLIPVVTSNDGDADGSKDSNKGTDMGNNMGSMGMGSTGMRNNTRLLEHYGIP